MPRPPVERDSNGLLPVEAIYAENYVRYRDRYTACRDAREQTWGRSSVGTVSAIQKHCLELDKNPLVQRQIEFLQSGVRQKLELDQMWFIRFLLEALSIDPLDMFETYTVEVAVHQGGETKLIEREKGRIRKDLPPHIRRMIQGVRVDTNGIPIAVDLMKKTDLFKMLGEISGALKSDGQAIADGLAELINDIQSEETSKSLIGHTFENED